MRGLLLLQFHGALGRLAQRLGLSRRIQAAESEFPGLLFVRAVPGARSALFYQNKITAVGQKIILGLSRLLSELRSQVHLTLEPLLAPQRVVGLESLSLLHPFGPDHSGMDRARNVKEVEASSIITALVRGMKGKNCRTRTKKKKNIKIII